MQRPQRIGTATSLPKFIRRRFPRVADKWLGPWCRLSGKRKRPRTDPILESIQGRQPCAEQRPIARQQRFKSLRNLD